MVWVERKKERAVGGGEAVELKARPVSTLVGARRRSSATCPFVCTGPSFQRQGKEKGL